MSRKSINSSYFNLLFRLCLARSYTILYSKFTIHSCKFKTCDHRFHSIYCDIIEYRGNFLNNNRQMIFLLSPIPIPRVVVAGCFNWSWFLGMTRRSFQMASTQSSKFRSKLRSTAYYCQIMRVSWRNSELNFSSILMLQSAKYTDLILKFLLYQLQCREC